MNGNENTVKCISRTYRVQTKGGLVVDVESTKALSVQLTQKLLQEDNDINSFFSEHKIMSIRQMVTIPTKFPKDKELESLQRRGKFSPRQRLNNLLKMKGEFSRVDYQKYMYDTHGVKIEKFMAYDDIRDAIKSKRLEVTESKIGRARKYRVVDPTDLDENLYKTLMKDIKIQMGAIQ